jgi:hypothetical protein
VRRRIADNTGYSAVADGGVVEPVAYAVLNSR